MDVAGFLGFGIGEENYVGSFKGKHLSHSLAWLVITGRGKDEMTEQFLHPCVFCVPVRSPDS